MHFRGNKRVFNVTATSQKDTAVQFAGFCTFAGEWKPSEMLVPFVEHRRQLRDYLWNTKKASEVMKKRD